MFGYCQKNLKAFEMHFILEIPWLHNENDPSISFQLSTDFVQGWFSFASLCTKLLSSCFWLKDFKWSAVKKSQE